MSHIFISYDHSDASFAGELRDKLQAASLTVWKDSQSLHGGDDWRAKIDEAIKSAYALVVVITPEAAASEYVSYEWACALGAGVKVIPLLLVASRMHARLGAMHYLDFINPDQRPWDSLIQQLQTAAEAYAPTSVKLPADAPAVVKKAVEALDSLDPEEQGQAIRMLTQIEHPSARLALAGAVHHYTRDVRIKAALELTRFKDPRALPGLIEAQRYWQLRWEFVRKITPFGSLAVPILLTALHDPDAELREYAAHALGEISAEFSVPALTKLLDDASAPVRDAARKAIEKISTTKT